MARKKIPIDLAKVEQLASICGTQEEIASALGISVDTLSRRTKDSADFAEVFRRGKLKGNLHAKSKLRAAINKGEAWAIKLYLATQCEGWSEKSQLELTGKNGGPIETKENKELTGAELKAELARRGLPTDILEE
jgi:hypothetical protein